MLPIATALVAIWLVTQTSETALVSALSALLGVALYQAARPPVRTVRVVPLVLVLALVGWVGANSPQVRWFGAQVSHGSRSGGQVAITFDDGPDVTATLQIARILDERGVKGTFFSVGRAVRARPDVTSALYEAGHLVANHSERHDSRGWLNPWYPELGEAQRAIDDAIGVCPAFYRAPHGQHTPFVARVVAGRRMTMVGWDVSVGDWSKQDGRRIADRVLAKVKPGSIIDLHDGLDGDVNADRSNLVAAMPYLLDGLAARRLTAVRLDVLLGKPGYVDGCGRLANRTRAAASGMAAKSTAASKYEVRDR